MVPIFKFLILGCNLNNDNTLLSDLLAEFTTGFALVVVVVVVVCRWWRGYPVAVSARLIL